MWISSKIKFFNIFDLLFYLVKEKNLIKSNREGGYSTEVEHLPHDQEPMGSNPTGCRFILTLLSFIFLYSSKKCVLEQVPRGRCITSSLLILQIKNAYLHRLELPKLYMCQNPKLLWIWPIGIAGQVNLNVLGLTFVLTVDIFGPGASEKL